MPGFSAYSVNAHSIDETQSDSCVWYCGGLRGRGSMRGGWCCAAQDLGANTDVYRPWDLEEIHSCLPAWLLSHKAKNACPIKLLRKISEDGDVRGGLERVHTLDKRRWASQAARTENRGVMMGMHGPVGG